jgi:hypothetical protein
LGSGGFDTLNAEESANANQEQSNETGEGLALTD